MEQRNNLVLQGTETFSRGQLDNVALDGGALVLDSVAGRCLQYGSYTTPEFAMPAFCNLNVSWNAFAPHNTMVEVRCRVYAGGNWTGWMSFGKWAPGYPRCSCNSQSDDGMIFLMGDTVTVATPGGGTGVQLQVNLSTNDDKVSPAVRLLAAAVRPLAWEKHNGHPLNRQLYLPEYCLSAHDPSFGRTMDLPLVMAALMNCWGEDVLPEEVAYVMEDMAHSTTANAAFAAAAAGCCGYPCWQAWMDLADLRAQIHDDCCVAVQVERRIRGQRDPVRVWMGLRGFGHDDAVMADYVLLNDPTADSNGAVNCTMALVDFMRYFTGRAIALRAKPRDVAANRPLRMRCELVPGETADVYYFEQRGVKDPLPEGFSGWVACACHDGVAHATTAHRSFCRMERTPEGGIRFPEKIMAAGCRCSHQPVHRMLARRHGAARRVLPVHRHALPVDRPFREYGHHDQDRARETACGVRRRMRDPDGGGVHGRRIRVGHRAHRGVLLHFHHVPDHFCDGDQEPRDPQEARRLVHDHGYRGRGDHAVFYGADRGLHAHRGGVSPAAVLLRLRRPVRCGIWAAGEGITGVRHYL